VVRFKNPVDGNVIVEDVIHGNVAFDNGQLDDLIIARSDGTPTYNFCVVVDDMDMKVTHVIRGDDHLNNTPRQINLLRALGAQPPVYAHVPMILGADGAKLSKRHGAVSVLQYRDDGYLPEALLNYLVRLGWSHGDQEVFSIAEMQALFDLKDVNAKAARMDPAKLGWLNQQYLKADAPEDVAKHLDWHLRQQGFDVVHGPKAADLVVALRDRVQTLNEMAARSAVWFHPLREYDDKAVAKHLTAAAQAPLADARERLAALGEWNVEAVSAALHATAEALGLGMGKVAQPLRVAITGTQVSPDIGHTVYLAGRDEALRRIDAALRMIPAEA
jgi:glutamyl-tRNA synthetase